MTAPGMLDAALATAAEAHAGQRRADGSPYFGHPLRVCDLLAETGADEPTLAAALLHDAVEDSELTVGAVVQRFGLEVGEVVAALTEDDAVEGWPERKDRLRAQVAAAGAKAAAVYAADKLANVRELRDLYSEQGEDAIELHRAPTLDLRIEAWRKDVEMLSQTAPGLALLPVLEAELTGFEAERMNAIVAWQEAGTRG